MAKRPVSWNGDIGGEKGEGVVLYKGNFVQGKKEGEGELNFPDGNCYAGNFKGDKYHGEGKLTWKKADGIHRYEGTFVDGEFEGEGTEFYPNGEKYTGGWMKNKRHGPGVKIEPRVYKDGKLEKN